MRVQRPPIAGAVSCPKCRGGCDLCDGTGQVPPGVARVYVREEARQTTKMPAQQLSRLRDSWPSEATTTPATLARAALVRRIALWTALVLLAFAIGVLGVVLIRIFA
jgi:hypothetical protein